MKYSECKNDYERIAYINVQKAARALDEEMDEERWSAQDTPSILEIYDRRSDYAHLVLRLFKMVNSEIYFDLNDKMNAEKYLRYIWKCNPEWVLDRCRATIANQFCKES